MSIVALPNVLSVAYVDRFSNVIRQPLKTFWVLWLCVRSVSVSWARDAETERHRERERERERERVREREREREMKENFQAVFTELSAKK